MVTEKCTRHVIVPITITSEDLDSPYYGRRASLSMTQTLYRRLTLQLRNALMKDNRIVTKTGATLKREAPWGKRNRNKLGGIRNKG